MQRRSCEMKHSCAKCGQALPKNASFCPTCGADLTQEGAIIKTTLKDRLAQKNATQSDGDGLQRWQKITLLVVIIAGVISYSSYAVIYASFKPSRQVTNLIHAYTNINTEAFYSMIELDDDIVYDSKTYMKFLFHVDKGMDGKFASALTKVGDEVYETGKAKIFSVPETEYNDAMEVFEVRPAKKFGFYKTIKFAPIAYDTTIVTDMQGLKLDILDKEYIFRGRDIPLGKFLPGDYLYTVFVTNKWIARDYPGMLRVPNSISETKLDFMSWNQAARLTSNVPNSELFINDEPTEKTVEELNELGPIVKNSIHVHAEYDNENGKRLRTATKYLKPGEEVYLYFPTATGSKEPTQSILTKSGTENFVKRYRTAYERALNTNTITPLLPFIIPGSAYEKELRTYFSTERDTAQFKYTFIETTRQNTLLDEHKAKVTTVEEYYFTDADGKSDLHDVKRAYEIHIDTDHSYKIYDVQDIK